MESKEEPNFTVVSTNRSLGLFFDSWKEKKFRELEELLIEKRFMQKGDMFSNSVNGCGWMVDDEPIKNYFKAGTRIYIVSYADAQQREEDAKKNHA